MSDARMLAEELVATLPVDAIGTKIYEEFALRVLAAPDERLRKAGVLVTTLVYALLEPYANGEMDRLEAFEVMHRLTQDVTSL